MNNLIKAVMAFMVFSASTFGQTSDKEAAYNQVITQRASKIVKVLQLPDSVKETRVRDMVAQQYRDLNTIHEGVKTAKKELSELTEEKVKQLENETNDKLDQLHTQYLVKLNKELSTTQVEQIKDGMTYGVLPITYRGYQEMLPDLTEAQKNQILAWLTEAREHAMDAESSERKHAWFGKYKGKINNYLSAQGIDMKKAGQEWEKRIKAEKK